MPIAAIYARVSSDKQREESTIASQTAALIAFAQSGGYQVPTEWVFEDEGYSGASLVRPGLERVRDLAAEGQIEAVLVHAPDRLSRKYAYQILLIEELARHGVDTVFMKAPRTATAEDQLLVQFQGMIAEYERAQILERSRRGKRHRARQGQVNVLSGAPYGYRYVRKSDDAAARYEIINSEADIVRAVYDHYVVAGMSIGAITRLLNERGVPTRKRISRWERSTVWAMLRNPAYKGAACFGKTETVPRQRITRPLRLRGGIGGRRAHANSRQVFRHRAQRRLVAGRQRPRVGEGDRAHHAVDLAAQPGQRIHRTGVPEPDGVVVSLQRHRRLSGALSHPGRLAGRRDRARRVPGCRPGPGARQPELR